jgi:hypothetical protein
MDDKQHFLRVDFHRFKAFEQFSLHLRHFNILVGPNNAGKSTVIAAFRILASAMRKARSRKPEALRGPSGNTFGYKIDLSGISVAEENIFFNYDESEAASVKFLLSNKCDLTLYFPEREACFLIADSDKGAPRTPTAFKKQFNCPIGFVPILGPVDHRESLFREAAARLALLNYTASRNFRNIWYHYPEKFEAFRELLRSTWPGMDIEPPVIDSYEKPILHMFCPEERIPREIFWSGFGFQVWCQMLTHLVQSSERSLFLIDEPDIYLHSDLQRQLLGLLRNLGPDILIATHSTEIITEAETDDIVLVNKKRLHSKRIKHPSELTEVFTALGSNLNPILTQLAKTRRAVFVEGKDFQVIGKFARKLGFMRVANRSDFAVIPVDGFNPERVRNLKRGMETTLGSKIQAAVILDRDYRSQEECDSVVSECKKFCELAMVHGRKEIENFLLVVRAVDRASMRRLDDYNRRTGKSKIYEDCVDEILDDFSSGIKTFITSRYLAMRRHFEKKHRPEIDETTSNEAALVELEKLWATDDERLRILPGKEVLSAINQGLQDRYGISLTATAIVDSMNSEEIPDDMRQLIELLADFAGS